MVDQSTRPFVYTARHDHESIQSHWTRPIALDGSEDNHFRNQHLLQGTEVGAEDHDIDAEPEDDDEEPFASDSH